MKYDARDYSSDSSFIVTTKSGETRYYGHRGNSRVYLPQVDQDGNPNGNQVIAVWLLDRVVDVWGNYYEIHYNGDASDFTTRGAIPTQIDYTGHIDAASQEVDVQPFNHVTFTYTNRKDPRQARFRDSLLPKNQLLTGITTPQGSYGLYYLKPFDDPHPMDPDTLTAIAFESSEAGGTCLSPLTVFSTDPDVTTGCVRPLIFDWNRLDPADPATPWWVDSPGYALQADFSGRGTQFVDLDGDGRPDFVQAKDGTSFKTWRNTGTGWELKTNWTLPTKLANSDGTPADTIFADIDGDGLPDLITSEGPAGNIWLNRLREDLGGTWVLQSTGSYSIGNLLAAIPVNDRFFRVGSGVYQGADINGDGRMELINAQGMTGPGACAHQVYVRVLSNDGNGWTFTKPVQQCGLSNGMLFAAKDVNRDGLADFVADDGSGIFFTHFGPAQTVPAWTWVPYNGIDQKFVVATGDVDGDGTYDQVFVKTVDSTISPGYVTPEGLNATAVSLNSGLGLATGGSQAYIDSLNTYSFSPVFGGTTPQAWNGLLGSAEVGRYQVADLNGDGLADVVVNHVWGGSLLVNRSSTFQDIGQISHHPHWKLGDLPESNYPFFDNTPSDPNVTNWIVSTGLSPDSIVPIKNNESTYPLDAYVDIDGDGIADRVQMLMQCDPAKSSLCTTPYIKKTFLNRYHTPFIKGFPNGLAQPTTVNYSVITSSDNSNYTDLAPRATNTAYLGVPLRVVKSVVSDDGIGSTATTTYSYSSLRMSTNGHGPLGFQQVSVRDPEQYLTVTTYSQVYPYVGRTASVVRTKEGIGTVAQTITNYQDVGGATRSIFIHPQKVTDTSRLYESPNTNQIYPLAETITTTTEYALYDGYGNPKTTTVTTTRGASATCSSGGDGDAGAGSSGGTGSASCESYQQQIDNSYGGADSPERKMGKPIETIVTSTKVAPLDPLGNVAITHTTDFEYSQDAMLALTRKKVEPNGVVGIRLDTAYHYDQFGNLDVTTNCASDFDSCQPGVANPADTSLAEHPPFRTTLVSYDPADFAPGPDAPTTSLGYVEKGRFPVRTTVKVQQAADQVQYSAYDPNWGVLIQSTGPNGINTCYIYDEVGWKLKQSERCGSMSPFLTKFERFLAGSSDSAHASLVTVTQPPTGATNWTYSDALGRTVENLGRSLAGGFTETLTEYDHQGHTKRTSKPFFPGDTIYWNTPHYDLLDRVDQVTQDLGSIDGTATAGSPTGAYSIQSTHYSGMSITSSTTVNGQIRTRTEQKNMLGKVSSATDANGVLISYTYDAGGNLTDTHDPSGNTVHIDYDGRGRKWRSADPDLGQWTYTYNGFGDLLTQTDAKNQTVTMTYDALGRTTTKTDAAGTATWLYDVAPGAGIGKLAATIGAPDSVLKTPCVAPDSVPNTVPTSGNRAMRWATYNTLGELIESSECTDGDTFTAQYEYDGAGRQSAVRYPEVQGERFSIKYHYTSQGFLQYVYDAADNKVYWEAKSENAAGQVTDEQTRNGVETISTRNPSTGWLLAQTAISQADGNNLIQGLKYKFDEAGNLQKRMRSEPRDMADSTETFGYDSLDRVTSSEVKVPLNNGYDASEGFHYDNLGNLTQKDGKTYSYTGCASGGGPHAVCTVGGGTPFGYDPNGNMTSGNGRTVTYNGANKVTQISQASGAQGSGTDVVNFAYGADGNRVVQLVGTRPSDSTDVVESSRTIYVGLGGTGKSIYERTTRGSTIEHVHFIYAGNAHGGNAFALRVATEGSSTAAGTTSRAASITYKYNHFDHLGSVTAMSDEMGLVGPASGGANATVMGYDVWGARRNPDGTSAGTSSFPVQVGHREFTGHETIPSVGLVNMNGRVYDPELGRFLSPDPNVQVVTDLQSYNRYSYVLNNPLRYTDPTGYFRDAWDVLQSSGFHYFEIGLGVLMCLNPVTCAVYAFAVVALNTAIMAHNGNSWDQIYAADLMTTDLAFMGGGLGGEVGASLGTGVGAAMVGGAVGAAVTTALTIPLTGWHGWGNLGENMLVAMAAGAATAGYQASQNPVSQASADVQQGGGDSNDRYEIAGRKGSQPTQIRDVTAGGLVEEIPFKPGKYQLSEAYADEIGNYYNRNLDYDVRQAEFEVVSPNKVSSAWGDEISLGMDYMGGDDNIRREVLAHELTHSADAQAAGGPEALLALRRSQAARYGEEGQYNVQGTVEGRANYNGILFMWPNAELVESVTKAYTGY